MFQTLQLLELAHSYKRMIPATLGITAAQLSVRISILYYGIIPYDTIRSHTIFLFIFVIWSTAEIVRYSYYVSKYFEIEHNSFKWMRYSLPVVLYPIGAGTDFIAVLLFHPVIVEKPLITRYDVGLLYILIFAFFIGFPKIYGHLLHQRNRILHFNAVMK